MTRRGSGSLPPASLNLLWRQSGATVFIAHVAKGGIDDSSQFCFGGSAGVLYTKPLDERRNVTSQSCGVDICPQISRLFRFLASDSPSLLV